MEQQLAKFFLARMMSANGEVLNNYNFPLNQKVVYATETTKYPLYGLLEFAFCGIPKENIKLDVVNSELTVTATTVKPDDKTEVYTDVLIKKIVQKDFNKTFTIPSGFDVDGIEALYENGLFTVKIPYKQPEVKSIKIF